METDKGGVRFGFTERKYEDERMTCAEDSKNDLRFQFPKLFEEDFLFFHHLTIIINLRLLKLLHNANDNRDGNENDNSNDDVRKV